MDDYKILQQILCDELNLTTEDLHQEKKLSDCGADSMEIFAILAAMEAEFHVEFDPEEHRHLRNGTIGDLVRLLEDYL